MLYITKKFQTVDGKEFSSIEAANKHNRDLLRPLTDLLITLLKDDDKEVYLPAEDLPATRCLLLPNFASLLVEHSETVIATIQRVAKRANLVGG